MDKYSGFDTEDFLIDDFFIKWVLHPSAEEDKIWSEWLLQHPEMQYKTDQARNIITSIKFNKVSEVNHTEVSSFIRSIKTNLQLNKPSEDKPERRVFNMQWFSTAAALIGGVILLAFLFLENKPGSPGTAKDSILVEQTNSTMSPILIYLADSTLVILKPKSVLKYPKSFLAANREVSLSGEAFFEVRKNKNKPFLVHSGKMITQVIGTSFTIKAFKGEDFKVIVNSGKVKVYTDPQYTDQTSSNAVKAVTLLAKQQVICPKDKAVLIKEETPTSVILSKEVTRKMFDFKGTSVNEIFNSLQDEYQVDIEYNEKTFSTCKLTASLYNDQLVEKLMIICKAVDANFTIKDGRIVITGAGCKAN